jgi:D-3-phosphoglycerate dehydrogenase / 2-oxoglutarate reductase
MATKAKFKVLVSDALGDAGLAVFKEEPEIQVHVKTGLSPAELKKIIPGYDAIVIRSGTQLTKDALQNADRLKVIGRAGVGIDNVDLETATKKGVIVMNTPEGNTMSTSEHTLSLLLALARNIPQAHESVHRGEWKRSSFVGTELYGKVLGVVGFGRIGREVTKRAAAFGMKIFVHDPFISKDSVRQPGVDFVDLNELYERADYITLHVPGTDATNKMLNRKAFQVMKKGVSIVNCARGSLIDEKALCEALESGKVRGAAVDVFETEPPKKNSLLAFDQVIATPHLGAATEEAQENVAVAVAKQVADALMERGIRNAVNMPSLDFEAMKFLRPWLTLAERIGSLQTQLFGGAVRKVSVRYGGELTQINVAPITIGVVRGLLAPACGATVNYVNAQAIASERGITVNESKTTEVGDFTTFVEVEVTVNRHKNIIMGILFGNRDPRVVRVNEFFIDMIPQGDVLVIHNEDQPGVVGGVGHILGKHKINIAEMTLGRVDRGKKTFAMTVINIDNTVPEPVLKELKAFPPIIDAKVIHF